MQKELKAALLYTCLISMPHVAFADQLMSFKNVSDGGNFASCCWTMAEGEITRESVELFRAHVEADSNPGFGGLARLSGYGSDIQAAIDLGRAFREHDWHVVIGESEQYSEPWYEEVQAGACVGTCILTFVGASHRSLDEGTTLEISQLLSDADFLPAATDRATDALSRAIENQIVVGQIVGYLDEMGIDPRLYTLMSAVPPTISMALTQDQRRDLAIENADDGVTAWRAEPRGEGLVAKVDTQLTDRTLELFCDDRRNYLAISIADFSRDDLLLVLDSGGGHIALETSSGNSELQFTGQTTLIDDRARFLFTLSEDGANMVANATWLRGYAPTAQVGRNWHALVFQTFLFNEIGGDPRLPSRVLQVCE